MQERIQLALILLLFALAGRLEATSFRSGAERVLQALTALDTALPSAAQLAARLGMEETRLAPELDALLARGEAAARVACDAAFGLRTAMRTYSPALHPDAVDYYVFSLGRILI